MKVKSKSSPPAKGVAAKKVLHAGGGNSAKGRSSKCNMNCSAGSACKGC